MNLVIWLVEIRVVICVGWFTFHNLYFFFLFSILEIVSLLLDIFLNVFKFEWNTYISWYGGIDILLCIVSKLGFRQW